MKTMISIIFISGMSMFMSCCSKLFSDEKFSMQRVGYNGNELRIDGYYYHQEESEKYSRTRVRFFYRNGIVLFAGNSSSLDLTITEDDILNRIEIMKKDKMNWALFAVNSSNVIIEQYYDNPPSSSLKTMKSFYEIKNDTTIILKRVDHPGYKNEIYNEIWHFKQFDNKPDSTNVYIK